MQIACPDARHLAPFILLALLVHAALLFVIHPPTQPRSPFRPMEVYLSARSVPPVHGISKAAAVPVRIAPPKQMSVTRQRLYSKTLPAPPAAKPEMPASAFFDSLMESARSIAHDDARKFEQHELAQEKRNLNTPIGALTQELRQPQKEIRMANGMLKIITAAGAVCFQPPPLFARDQAGLYGIPRTCP